MYLRHTTYIRCIGDDAVCLPVYRLWHAKKVWPTMYNISTVRAVRDFLIDWWCCLPRMNRQPVTTYANVNELQKFNGVWLCFKRITVQYNIFCSIFRWEKIACFIRYNPSSCATSASHGRVGWEHASTGRCHSVQSQNNDWWHEWITRMNASISSIEKENKCCMCYWRGDPCAWMYIYSIYDE